MSNNKEEEEVGNTFQGVQAMDTDIQMTFSVMPEEVMVMVPGPLPAPDYFGVVDDAQRNTSEEDEWWDNSDNALPKENGPSSTMSKMCVWLKENRRVLIVVAICVICFLSGLLIGRATSHYSVPIASKHIPYLVVTNSLFNQQRIASYNKWCAIVLHNKHSGWPVNPKGCQLTNVTVHIPKDLYNSTIVGFQVTNMEANQQTEVGTAYVTPHGLPNFGYSFNMSIAWWDVPTCGRNQTAEKTDTSRKENDHLKTTTRNQPTSKPLVFLSDPPLLLFFFDHIDISGPK